ncbi:MAG: glycosyltransferase family 2 protein [Candidatus Falkowbacteria bacterium]
MDLSIVIVSWKVKNKLSANLSALFKSQGDFKYEVFVVDNYSCDGTVEMVSTEFPQVTLIANKENLGFAAANNQALKQTKGKYILLLNPDMQVRPDTLSKMLDWAKNNPQATVSGCKLINERGEIIRHVRRFPKFPDQLAVSLKLPHVFPKIVDHYLASDFDYSQAAKVDSIRGAFFLINREAYERISATNVPLLDGRYFIWFEEVDFCRAVLRFGGEVWYTPVAECVDYVGASFAQVKRGQAQKYFSDSMIKYFQKWEAPWQTKILKFVWSAIKILV